MGGETNNYLNKSPRGGGEDNSHAHIYTHTCIYSYRRKKVRIALTDPC